MTVQPPKMIASCAVWSLLAGCGVPESPGDQGAQPEFTGPVQVVRSQVANESPDRILVEELRIGSLDSEGPDAFTYLKGLVALDDGGFVVLDSQLQELRVFGADGTHRATHGSRGEGPGEFVDANGLMAGPDGRIWVPDSRNGRMSVVDPEDGFTESFPFVDNNFNWLWNGAMVDQSRIYRPRPTGERDEVDIYDLTMTKLETFPFPEAPQGEEYDPSDQPGTFYRETEGGGFMMVRIPFWAHQARFIDSRGTLWFTESDNPDYRIQRWRAGTDTSLVIETRRPPVAVSQAERDSVIGSLQERFEGNRWDWSRIPEVKPAVEAIFESAEGNLWVQTPTPDGGFLFDLYSAGGDYLETVALETELSLWDSVVPVVQGDMVWMVATDELDINYVVRARIVPTGGDSPAQEP